MFMHVSAASFEHRCLLVPGVLSVSGKCPPPNSAWPLSQLGCSLTPCSMPGWPAFGAPRSHGLSV